MATTVYTSIIEKNGEISAAKLREAVELFLECADPAEAKRRLRTEVFVTRIEARHE